MDDKMKMYLEEVKQYLKPLEKVEQDDIIQELEISIMKMRKEGMDEEAIFQRLGTPTNLAKAYLADLLLKQKFSLRKCMYFLVLLGVCGL